MNLHIKGGIFRLSPTSQDEPRQEIPGVLIAIFIIGLVILAGSLDRWADPANQTEVSND